MRVLSSFTRSFILAFFTDISSALADSQIFTADWKKVWKINLGSHFWSLLLLPGSVTAGLHNY